MKHAQYVGQNGKVIKDSSELTVEDVTNVFIGKLAAYLAKEARVECNPKKT